MARVFVTNHLPGTALDRLGEAHEMQVWPERTVPPPDELRRKAAEAEGLLSMLTDRVDAELIEACPNLRAISNYAVGVDNVDLAAATARGIPVGNTPGVLTARTAGMAGAPLLAAARGAVEGAHGGRPDAGGGAASRRERRRGSARRMADLGARVPDRPRPAPRDRRNRGLRPHRPSSGAARRGLRLRGAAHARDPARG